MEQRGAGNRLDYGGDNRGPGYIALPRQRTVPDETTQMGSRGKGKPLRAARILAPAFVIAVSGCKSRPTDTEGSWPVMGTTLRVHAWAPDSVVRNRALQAAHDEVVLIDNLMSTYQENSEISTVNRRAGTDSITYVSPSMTSVLAAAQEYGRKTDGAFDVTVGPLVRVWGFHEHKGRLPTAAQIDSARRLVGIKRIDFRESERIVRLPQRRMQLDFSAIAKGFAVERAASALRAAGVPSGMVTLGGDVFVFGPAPAERWRVAVRDPRDAQKTIATVQLDSGAVSTTDDGEQFFIEGGKRYAHIFDPRTGQPVQGVASVTVIAPTGTASDALATALFVLGPARGCAVALREQVDALWLTMGSGERDLRLTMTQGMEAKLQPGDSLPRTRCPG